MLQYSARLQFRCSRCDHHFDMDPEENHYFWSISGGSCATSQSLRPQSHLWQTAMHTGTLHLTANSLYHPDADLQLTDALTWALTRPSVPPAAGFPCIVPIRLFTPSASVRGSNAAQRIGVAHENSTSLRETSGSHSTSRIRNKPSPILLSYHCC